MRPTKYKPEMCDTVIELLSVGKSLTYCAARLGVDVDTIASWRSDNAEFADAMKRGMALSQAYWEDEIQASATGENKSANHTSLIFIMKNRFRNDYKDRHDVNQSLDANINVREARDLSDDELKAIVEGVGEQAQSSQRDSEET